MRLPSALIACLTFGLAAMTAEAAPVTYTIDPVHSRITFYVNHFGFSNPVGEFKLTEGPMSFDQDDWSKSSVAAEIAVSSLYMGDEDKKWYNHIESKDFLNAAEFPTISFKSTRLAKTDATHGKLSGDLTIHGVTKPVVLDLRLNKAGMHPMRKTPAVGFTATTQLKRSDFGVNYLVPMVSDEIDVRIEIEAYVPPPPGAKT